VPGGTGEEAEREVEVEGEAEAGGGGGGAGGQAEKRWPSSFLVSVSVCCAAFARRPLPQQTHSLPLPPSVGGARQVADSASASTQTHTHTQQAKAVAHKRQRERERERRPNQAHPIIIQGPRQGMNYYFNYYLLLLLLLLRLLQHVRLIEPYTNHGPSKLS